MNAAVLLLALTVAAEPAADSTKPLPPQAKVTVTASITCSHCEFNIGDSCGACLKLDEKTPVLLEGKLVEALNKERFSEKVFVAQGTLSVNKDRHLVLNVESAHALGDADKDKAPPAGAVRVEGSPACAHCDLHIGTSCNLAIKNAAHPILVEKGGDDSDGKVAIVVGRPYVDKDGLLHVEARQVKLEK
jgi:hypothetical protein